MNTEKQKIELDIPSDFKFEEPTLREFSYNENTLIQGGTSGRAKTWDQQVMDDLVSNRNKKKY